MDFSEINKLNLNVSSTSKKEKKVENKIVENLQKNIPTEKSPSNPSYWQSAAGVKRMLHSFKGNSDEISEEYVSKKIETTLEPELEYKYESAEMKAIIKESVVALSSYGKSVVDNCLNLLSKNICYMHTKDQVASCSNISAALAKILPSEVSDENVNKIASLILPVVHSANKTFEEKTTHVMQTILQKEDASMEDRLIWLDTKIVDTSLMQNCSEDNPFFATFENDFDTDVKVMTFLPTDELKKSLLKIGIPSEEMEKLAKLYENPQINQDEFKETITTFLNYTNSYWSDKEQDKENIINFIDKLYSDETVIPTLNRLMKASDFNGINSVINLNVLLNGDLKLLNDVLDALKSKKEKPIDALAPSMNEFMEFLKVIDESSLSDFIEITQGMKPEDSIYFAEKYINPITKKIDKSLFDKEKELENYYSVNYNILPILYASVDGKTGELSPVADELIGFLFPVTKQQGTFSDKLKNLKSDLKQKIKAHSQIKISQNFASMKNDSLPNLINSLKNSDGEFVESNLQAFYKLLRSNRKINSRRYIELDDITKVLNEIKDDKGIVDRRKLNFAVKTLRYTESYVSTYQIMKSLNGFPSEKCDEILAFCNSLGKDNNYRINNIPCISKFCFDEKGIIKPENAEFVKELLSKQEKKYTDEFFEMVEQKPHLRKFILDIIPNISQGLVDFINEINAFDTEDKKINSFEKEKMMEYAKCNGALSDFSSLYNACFVNGQFDDELFKKALNLIEMQKKTPRQRNAIVGKQCVDIINQNLSVSNIKFKDKVHILDALRSIRENVKQNNISGFDYIEKAISDIEASLTMDDIGLPIKEEDKLNFLKNVLRATGSSTEYTEFEQVMIDAIPELETMTSGVRLTYSREEFLKDLSKICNTQEDIDLLTKKTDITPILGEDDKEIVGYNGLIRLSDLDLSNPKEKQIYDCMHKFMYDNQANTSNTKLNEQLNYIFKACPEFINVVGKKQHGTQKYTVDVHSLLVMAYSLQNPDYLQTLNALDRGLLKMSAIFHDIMKQEGIVDKGHQSLSSLYTRGISKKIFISEDMQDRLFELIDNHHWTEEYSNAQDKKAKAQQLAFRFRRPNDFEIEKIMARSDLQAVSMAFYEKLKGCLDEDNLKLIQDNLDALYASGNLLFTDKVLSQSKSKKHIEMRDGKEYRVINLHEIPDGADMGDYGFNNGQKKQDLTFLVHMVDSTSIYSDLYTVKLLASPMNGGVLSESIITPQYKRTYCDRKYGVILSQINPNIINESEKNQASGTAKDFSSIMDLIFSNSHDSARNKFRYSLLRNLGIDPDSVSSKEYGDFYRTVLAGKTSPSMINPNAEYKIGIHSFTGKDLVNAIKQVQESMIDKQENGHNEIVGYTPKINAVIAKVPSFDMVPDELLKFAYENNLPVVLI